MVLKLDGNSEHVAHVWRKIHILSKNIQIQLSCSMPYRDHSIRARLFLSYHLLSTICTALASALCQLHYPLRSAVQCFNPDPSGSGFNNLWEYSASTRKNTGPEQNYKFSVIKIYTLSKYMFIFKHVKGVRLTEIEFNHIYVHNVERKPLYIWRKCYRVHHL